MCFHRYTITIVRLLSHFKMFGWIWMCAKRWCRIKPNQITHNVSAIYLDDSFVRHSLWKRNYSESLPLKFCTKGEFLFELRSELLLECYDFRNISDSWLVRFHTNALFTNITIGWHKTLTMQQHFANERYHKIDKNDIHFERKMWLTAFQFIIQQNFNISSIIENVLCEHKMVFTIKTNWYRYNQNDNIEFSPITH